MCVCVNKFSKSVFSDRGAIKLLDFLNFTMANLATTFTSLILRRAGSLVTPARREFHEKVIDHPRNVGKLDAKKSNVGTGLVGAPACGDVMKLQESSCLVRSLQCLLI